MNVPLQGFFRSWKIQFFLVSPLPPCCCLAESFYSLFDTWIKDQLLKNKFLLRNSCKTNPLEESTLWQAYFFALPKIPSPLKKCIFNRVPGANWGWHLLYACFVHMVIFLGLSLVYESLSDWKHRHPKQHDRLQSCNGINTCRSTWSLQKRPSPSFFSFCFSGWTEVLSLWFQVPV